MNLARAPLTVLRVALRLGYNLRRVLPKQTSRSFGRRSGAQDQTIEKIYVINLDREPGRWSSVKKELSCIRDAHGNDLLSLAERHPAVDARSFLLDPPRDAEVDPFYTLADQLFVEPQPLTLPTQFELEAPIRMSRPEVAVAKSHIDVWRRVAHGTQTHALILEDDVWFHPTFGRHLDQAWKDLAANGRKPESTDILYVSYMEATRGARKSFISSHVFKPERGLWNLSGYILSREGAAKLLRLLPCRGPVDLWINQQFSALNVLATSRAVVRQRRDTTSTNSYSILPTLSTIGAIDSEGAALFHARPPQLPVFAFGPANSGQSSVAMALAMLGYRCCSDLEGLPFRELERLREGSADRVFGAYVNIGCLEPMIEEIRRQYPQAKFIVTASSSDATSNPILARLEGADVAVLDPNSGDAWRILCEHLRCVPPLAPFPRLDDLGQRHIVEASKQAILARRRPPPKWDRSPWIVAPVHHDWSGIEVAEKPHDSDEYWVEVGDGSGRLDPRHWSARSDTFTGNLALFRPLNVEQTGVEGATIHIRREELGVRHYSAGALNSHADYVFGRFESTFQASDVPGVITGFFLHRNSPHQEIDIEIAGNMPDRLLVNVFYNPGDPGAKFDYGYRGCPSYIELGFDASKGLHRYAIEWRPNEIRWLVDDRLVHRRVIWDPTPIPNLPMKLHFNAWPCRASSLAGRLSGHRLPAKVRVQSIRTRTHPRSAFRREAKRLLDSDIPVATGVSM